jgi:hypothetical protein
MVEEQLLASVKMNVFFPVTPIQMPVTLEALRNAKSRKVAYQVDDYISLDSSKFEVQSLYGSVVTCREKV